MEAVQRKSRSSKRKSGSRKTKRREQLDLEDVFQNADFSHLYANFNKWLEQELAGTGQTNAILFGTLVVGSFFSLFMSAFAALIPLTHGFLGSALHTGEGWKFYQPGVGGPRFIALQGVAWSFYGFTMLLHLINLFVNDFGLHITAFFTGFFALTFMVSSLMTYQGPNRTVFASVEASKTNEDYEWAESEHAEQFNERMQKSILMMNGDNPSGMWWVFIAMEAALAFATTWAMLIVDLRKGAALIKAATAFFGLAAFAGAIPCTHAIGGKWKHIRTSYTGFQPGVGGPMFVSLQAGGWAFFAFTLLTGLVAVASSLLQVAGKNPIMPFALTLTGLLGMISESLILGSLFVFKEGKEDRTRNPLYEEEETVVDSLLDKILLALFAFANYLFQPRGRGDPMEYSRSPVTLSSPDDHFRADKRWEECISSCETTGDTYLVVGCGFVGKRLVKRLLERGETKVKIFDIVPTKDFEGDERVEFIRGDVTKLEDISKACEGVDTVYATFALIRFMERLEHQAFLSYHVNVTGTKVLFEALKQNNISKIIVTSSSHATTDEHSQPRLNRDESAPYVTRETAHNHYGWTKALADRYALKQNGKTLSNGETMKVVIVRPCSGVFGADDRLSFEKCFDMGVAPGIGIDCVMDWVYVENVVLGHLLAEARLQDGTEGVCGEAFNISNNDATTWLDFWFMAKKIANMMPKKISTQVNIEFVFVPMSLIWVVAYISEGMQRLFKGKVSLGRDVDSLTPAMLQTALMSYSYNSDKAEKILGYKPAFTLEEGVQRSIYEYYHNKKAIKEQ